MSFKKTVHHYSLEDHGILILSHRVCLSLKEVYHLAYVTNSLAYFKEHSRDDNFMLHGPMTFFDYESGDLTVTQPHDTVIIFI